MNPLFEIIQKKQFARSHSPAVEAHRLGTLYNLDRCVFRPLGPRKPLCA